MKNYQQECEDQWQRFAPSDVSVYGLMRKEADTVMKILASRTVTTYGLHLSVPQHCNYENIHVCIRLYLFGLSDEHPASSVGGHSQY
jgi:hypothetical protein